MSYAALHLLVVLPVYIFALPRETPRMAYATTANPTPESRPQLKGEALIFAMLAATITMSSAISAVVSVHLLTILQARDIALAAAVALGALVGPSQVGARAIEMVIGRYHHPIWTMVASTVLMAIGLSALWLGLPVIALALVFYGTGLGIESIARGTLPLALFGEAGYAARMGRLAMPSLIAQAASPSLGALLIEHSGAGGTLAVLSVAAAINVLLVAALFACSRI